MNCFLVFVLAFVALSDAAQVPKYFNKCTLGNKEKLSKCTVKSANDGWHNLINGDKSVHIPPMNPLVLSELLIDVDGNLKIELHDSKLYGLEDIHFDKIEIDTDKSTIDVAFTAPSVTLLGPYEVHGRILLLPIQGKGPCNITFVGGSYQYHADIILKEKNNIQYIKIKSQTMTYDLKRAYFKLDNLFNGDKLLGEEMNKVLDENWKDVNKEIGVKIGDTLGVIGSSIMGEFFNHVSHDEIFLKA